MRICNVILLTTTLTVTGCSERQPVEPDEDSSGAPAVETATMDGIAERYVRLALAFSAYDGDYVDAYFGPEEWRAEAGAVKRPLETLKAEATTLIETLAAMEPESAQVDRLRRSLLSKRLIAMRVRMGMAAGIKLSFDQETEQLFDVRVPDYDAAHFQGILEQIDALIPGSDPLHERVAAFQSKFVIPKDRLKRVFDRAIAECRKRTLTHLSLPQSENFEVEFVNDKPWSGYNWYKGDYFSLIQINTDLPIYIKRAVDLGCHEAYPGHHTYNILLERDLQKGRGWMEFTINPLYGPQSPISEGSANFGIDMAFPGNERAIFEKEVLFPLAGLGPSEADRYYRLLELLDQLSYADNDAARDYLDGKISRADTIDWIVAYRLYSLERASQRVDFIEKYRSYVINYNYGKDLVERYVETRAGDDAERRWAEFERVLSLPLTPSDM